MESIKEAKEKVESAIYAVHACAAQEEVNAALQGVVYALFTYCQTLESKIDELNALLDV